MPIDPDRAAAYELAYREGVRALEDQRSIIDGYRTRAGLLLSAAAISTSFLGSAALDRSASVLCSLALGVFVLLGLLLVAMLWPSDDARLTGRPRRLIEAYVEPNLVQVALIHRDLAMHDDANFMRNRARMWRFELLFRMSSILLVLNTILWVAGILTGR